MEVGQFVAGGGASPAFMFASENPFGVHSIQGCTKGRTDILKVLGATVVKIVAVGCLQKHQESTGRHRCARPFPNGHCKINQLFTNGRGGAI